MSSLTKILDMQLRAYINNEKACVRMHVLTKQANIKISLKKLHSKNEYIFELSTMK